MGSNGFGVVRALLLLVLLGLCGSLAFFYFTRHEGAITGPKVQHPRAAAAATTPVPDCKDHLIHGLHCHEFPGVCSDPFGREVCQKTCHVCGAATTTTTSTTMSTQGECKDHVDDDLTCAQVQDFCKDRFAHQLCPKFCGFCGANATATATPSKPTQASPVSTTTTTSSYLQCVDHVGNGFRCAYLPGICQSIYGHLLCQRHCVDCAPNSGQSTTPSTSGTVPPKDSCVDFVTGAFSCNILPGVCGDSVGLVVCRRYCGVCTPSSTKAATTTTTTTTQSATPATTTTTTPTTTTTTTTAAATGSTVEPCVDHVVHGFQCNLIPGICNNLYGHLVCPRHCGVCNSANSPATNPGYSPPAGSCVDFVGHGQRCHHLPNVCQDTDRIGPMLMCPKFCGTCSAPSTMTTTMTTSKRPQSHTPSAAATTTTTTTKETTSTISVTKTTASSAASSSSSQSGCNDNIGNGMKCSPSVCGTSFGAMVCPKTCHQCGHSGGTIATAATATAGTATAATATGTAATATAGTAATATATAGTATATATTTGGGFHTKCKDNVANGLDCQVLKASGFCTDHYAKVFCRRTCNFCNDTATTATTTTTTSATLSSVTSPSSVTSSSAPCKPRYNDTSCRDEAEESICTIPQFCKNDVARAVCKRTCQFCEDGCIDRLPGPCEDLYKPGGPVASKAELCSHVLGIQVCEAHCGCPGFCSLTSTVTVAVTSSQP